MPYNVVITGASRGIGLALARVFSFIADDDAYNVIATCRTPETAGGLQDLNKELRAAARYNLQIESLDVTDIESVACFKAKLKERPIDILINNAGMYGPNAPLLPVDIEKWHEVFHLNCIAPVFLIQQLCSNVKTSRLRKVITISSDMGSIGLNKGGGAYLYRSSKAGLNAAMASLALDLKPFDISVAMLHPGHAKTDMGGPNASVELEDSAAGLYREIKKLDISQTGCFRSWCGETLPW